MFTLRKCEKYTNWEATKAVNFNPVEFQTLPDFPFTGDVESEEDFVTYMHELYYEDWYDICDQLEEADRTELADQIATLFEGDMEIYSSSTDKYSTEWFDIGDVDEDYVKYGGFRSRHNTLGNN